MDYRTYLKNYPDKNGRFGAYGGAYLSDELKPAFEEITEAYHSLLMNFAESAESFREDQRRYIIASDYQRSLETVRFTSRGKI